MYSSHKIYLEYSKTFTNIAAGEISYFVFSCSLPEVFLELIMEEAEEAREELKLFLFPSSAFTWNKESSPDFHLKMKVLHFD